MDEFGEEFGHNDIADLGQTELFKLSGDPTAWTLSNNNRPDTLSNLITFTTQGDLPLSWTVRASLAQSVDEALGHHRRRVRSVRGRPRGRPTTTGRREADAARCARAPTARRRTP